MVLLTVLTVLSLAFAGAATAQATPPILVLWGADIGQFNVSA